MDSSAELQIWNNAAFDNGEISEDLAASKQSWGSLKSIFGNPKSSFDSVSGKENQGFALENPIPPVSPCLKSATSAPFKPLNAVESVQKSRPKEVVKIGFRESAAPKPAVKEIRDGRKIDEEIEEIESQISSLKSRLEALRLEKAERSVKAVVEKRGRVVAAKFMEEKQIGKNAEEKKSIVNDEVSSLSSRTKGSNRRGISLGPAEIMSGGRRGMSLCPSEIFGAAKSRQLVKQEMITPLQSRRKSCFLKLQDIEEERVKSCSLSPKSRKVGAKSQAVQRQAVTTIGSRKTVKKDDLLMNSVQPKKLFKDGEKSTLATNKKALRPGRMVASRYNQNSTQASSVRKRSLPENDAENSKRVEKKRSLSVEKTRPNENEGKVSGSECRVKKRWEIPSEVVVHGSVERESYSPCLLPKLRIARCNESPRDSGPAKKAAELVGRKPFFASDEALEQFVCQALSYGEEEEEEEDEES